MRFEIRRVFLLLTIGPGGIIVAVFLQDDGLVWCEGVSIAGNRSFLEDVVGSLVHGERGACRVGGAGAGCWADWHGGDRWRVGQSPHVHGMRPRHVGREVSRPRITHNGRVALARGASSRRQTVASVATARAYNTQQIH